MAGNPRKNAEGYADPTAYYGTKEIIEQETEAEKKNRAIIYAFRQIAELAGFEIVGRITLKEKKTGRLFK